MTDGNRSLSSTVQSTMRQILGYPTRQCLYRWLRERNAPIKSLKVRKKFINTVEHPLHPSMETKLNILHRCFELGENVQLVSEETGYSRTAIYTWRRRYMILCQDLVQHKMRNFNYFQLTNSDSLATLAL